MRFAGTLMLGVALAIGSVAVAEDRSPGSDVKPLRETAAPAKADEQTVEEHPGWMHRLIPALQRLRLNPGHDLLDRAGALSLRP